MGGRRGTIRGSPSGGFEEHLAEIVKDAAQAALKIRDGCGLMDGLRCQREPTARSLSSETSRVTGACSGVRGTPAPVASAV
jgi:hypothetical protein